MNELLSYDITVALGNSTKSGSVIFAKSSDRPLGESQPLCLLEAKDYPDQKLLSCTYIFTPQVSRTHKALGSKPYWMWGSEHGMNEWGVAIGNEAVWSREEEERENGLPGMDLVRLGLERPKTAYEALHAIVDLPKACGQGGNVSVIMDFRCHNSFLIADTCEAWIPDVVNRHWVARRVKNVEGISNRHGTGEHWDENSGDIQEYVYEMGHADRGQTSDFARAYGAVNLKLRVVYLRYKRLNQLLDRKKSTLTPDYIGNILKDHSEGEIIEPRWSPADGILVSVCMHDMDESSSKTAAGSVVKLSKGKIPVRQSCTSNPCILVFLPFIMETAIPQKVLQSSARYSNDSFWRRLERLSYEPEEDYPRNTALWNSVKERLQKYIYSLAEKGLDDSPLCETTSRLEEVADEMYLALRDANASSSQPQREIALKAVRTMVGII